MAICFPAGIWSRLLAAMLAALTLYTPVALRAEEHRPGVAVYPFRAVPASTATSTLSARADLLSALLTTRLAESDHISLLDRTELEALFAERSLSRGQGQSGNRKSLLPALPLSEYTVTGKVFTEEGSDRLSVRVVGNSNGEVLGILRTAYQASAPDKVIGVVSNWVDALIQRRRGENEAVEASADKRIGIGNFECLSDDAQCHTYAGMLSDWLIERYLPSAQYRLVARTQVVPLVVEDVLRNSRQIARVNTIQDRGARYLVHGKLRTRGPGEDMSLYLYLEDVEQGRTLEVLSASDWKSLFLQADEAIKGYFRLSGGTEPVANDSLHGSSGEVARIFLAALKQLSVVSEKATSVAGLASYQFRAFAARAPARRAEALALINRALGRDADYLPALLAKAVIIGADGDVGRSRTILRRVANSKDPAVDHIAFELLQEQWRRGQVGPDLFEDIVDKSRAAEIINQLLDEGYLERTDNILRIRRSRMAERIINRPHLLALNGVPADTAVRIFERLRARIHTQGMEVRFLTPKSYYPRELKKNFRTRWRQFLYHDGHGRESVMLRELGKGSAGIALARLGDITHAPSIHYGEVTSAGPLESGIDGFASSVFVEPSNLQSLVLLGRTLCDEAIGQCSFGRMINAWVVDYTSRRHGTAATVSAQAELDGYIFLAAVAVDALEQANLSTLGRQMDDYNEALRTVKQRSDQTGQLTGSQLKKTVAEYARKVLIACQQMVQARPALHSMHRMEKYLEPMNALAQLAKENDRARAMRSQHLARVVQQCSEGYPYLVLAMRDDAEFLVQEQDEMVARVLQGEITPALISEFIQHSVALFERRVESGRLDSARAYIRRYGDYHGISAETALDFAYLYHRVNDEAEAQRMIDVYGRKHLELSGYTITAINGSYVADGFDKRDRLLYRKESDDRVLLRYEGRNLEYSVGMTPVKWDLTLTLASGKTRYLHGNRNNEYPDSFCFGNGGKMTGNIQWPLLDEARPPQRFTDKAEVRTPTVTLQPISVQEPVAAMLLDGYILSPSQDYAIKSYPYGSAAGPLRPRHFNKALAASRDVDAIIDKLFTLEYLTVSGVPQVHPYKERERVKRDFPELKAYERRYLKEALLLAGKKPRAGYAEIHRREGKAWQLQATLSAADAEKDRRFASNASLTNRYAFVCDRRGSLYVFQRNDDDWQQQQRFSSRCRSVVGNDRWAATQGTGKVVVFANVDGVWRRHQELYPHNHLLREDKRKTSEYFGEALVFDGDTLFVGDPYYSSGEVTLFNLVGDQWTEADRLSSPPSLIHFGKSLAAGAGRLIVGSDEKDPEKYPFDLGGQALVYHKGANGWQLDTKLIPQKGDERAFAQRLWLPADRPESLYLHAKDNVYHHKLPK